MSNSGIFTIITNKGGQDELLNAQDLLIKRINTLIHEKQPKYSMTELASLPNDGYLRIHHSLLPSLNMIEKTHNTFINGTYKPYIPIGFEYNKVSMNNPVLGNTLEYTIPQFGSFFSDMVLHIRLKGLSAIDNRDRVRYVAFLGHKLVEHVSFTIAGNPIDEYTTDDYNAYYQFEVMPHKKIGWLRGIGQEIPKLMYVTSDPAFDMQREYRWVGDGNQTLKQFHGAVDLFVPLIFWFRNIKHAIPNHIIPFGQTNINVKLAEVGDIVGFADYGGGGAYKDPVVEFCNLHINNIFTIPEIMQLFIKKFSFSLIRVHRHHKQQLQFGSELGEEVRLHNLKWPIESLYLSFRPRENLGLSQHWHKSTKLTTKSLKIPVVAKNINTVIAGAVSLSNSSSTASLISASLSAIDDTYNSYDFVITGGAGFNTTDITLNRYIVSSYDGGTKTVTLTTNWTGPSPNSTTTFDLFTGQLAINIVSYYQESPVINTLSLKAHGVEIYKNNSEGFYNHYLPFNFGSSINTPSDRGMYMINFNFYPGDRQPSGVINISRAREFYLRYTSDLINDNFPVDLIVLGRAINFFLVKSGVGILRFTT